jgi:CBS domain containing-hemolysin-like protein
MELFRAKSADIALVVDEFGGILGMVTMKDLMETIAGDFPEEYEREEAPSIEMHADQSFTVDGSLEYTIPNEGDFVDFYGYRFEVLSKENRRIERVRITRAPPEDET